jgi:hypothetical protein
MTGCDPVDIAGDHDALLVAGGQLPLMPKGRSLQLVGKCPRPRTPLIGAGQRAPLIRRSDLDVIAIDVVAIKADTVGFKLTHGLN